jgi:transcriptional regulator with XRE-family HTH domain
MRLLVSSSQQELLIVARQKLGMTQRRFSDAVGSSLRTVARWEGGNATPSPAQHHKLAALLYPIDRARAHDAALFGGKTLEELGLVEPLPAPAPAPESASASVVHPAATAAKAVGALPTRVLVDAVLFAAIDALGASPATFDAVRAALHAAFAHASDLRLDPADVAKALAPPVPETEAVPVPSTPSASGSLESSTAPRAESPSRRTRQAETRRPPRARSR